VGILIYDDQFKIVYANKKVSDILGEPLENLINEDFRQFIETEKKKKKKINIYLRQKEGENIDNKYEFTIANRDGNTRIIEMNSRRIEEVKGRSKTIMQIFDKTHQRKTENDLKESEHKFKKIFEAIPDLFFLVAEDTTILDYKGEEDSLFLLPEKFLNKKLNEILPKDLGKIAQEAIMKTLKTKEQQVIEYQISINNEIRFFEGRLLPFSDNKVAMFIRDINERKESEKLVKEEVNRLKKTDKIRKDLISRVSHELKTPIMAISGATEYLLEAYGKKIGKEPSELLNMISSNEKRLEQLIDDLLDISRIDYDKIKLEKTKYNIYKLIMNISKELEYLIRERELNLEINISNTIELEIDIIRIEQVVINLLSNAIKNTPPRGKISIHTKISNNFIEIYFKDTGVGLTHEEIDKLFTQFGKIERYGEGLEYLDIKGSGLGLYISKKIIEMHNGEIQVISEGRNKGSTFIIILPSS